MEGGTRQATVTPEGVRDGDPAVLQWLVARRGPGVLALCERVCDAEEAPVAAAEAFARFRAAVAAAPDPGALDADAILLSATRHAAAALAAVPDAPRRRRSRRGGADLREVPGLVAAAREGALSAEDAERLAALFAEAPDARAVEAAFAAGEAAYRRPPAATLTPGAQRAMLAGLRAAAPLATEDAAAVLDEADLRLADEEAAAWGGGVGAPADGSAGDDEARAVDGAPVAAAAGDGEGPARDAPVAAAGPEVVASAGDSPGAAAAAEPGGAPGAGDGPGQETSPGDGDPPVAAAVTDPTEPAPDAPAQPIRATRLRPTAAAAVGGAAAPARPAKATGVEIPRAARRPHRHHATRTDHGVLYRFVLPLAVVVAGLLVLLAVAGVFGGGHDDAAPRATQARPAAETTPPATTADQPVALQEAARRAARRRAAERRAADRRRALRVRRARARRRAADAARAAAAAETRTTTSAAAPQTQDPAPAAASGAGATSGAGSSSGGSSGAGASGTGSSGASSSGGGGSSSSSGGSTASKAPSGSALGSGGSGSSSGVYVPASP